MKNACSLIRRHNALFLNLRVVVLLLGVFLLPTSSFGVDGTIDPAFYANALNIGTVHVLARQPDGKLLVGGNFQAINGQSCYPITRLNADGTIDPSFQPPTVTGTVYSILVQPDGKIIVGGSGGFTTNGVTRYSVFRLNPDGSSDAVFNSGEGARFGTIYAALLQADGKVLIGGNLSTYNGNYRNHLIRLNTDGTIDPSYSPLVSGESSNQGIFAMSLQTDGKAVIVGEFIRVSNEVARGIARINTDGTRDTTFAASITSTNNFVWSVDIQSDGKIIICGIFGQVSGVNRNKIARLNADGSVDAGFSPSLPFAIHSARKINAQPDGRILIGGSFDQVSGFPRSNIARLEANGAVDLTFSGSAEGIVYEINVSDSIVLGGSFSKVNALDSFGLARLDDLGRRDPTFDVGIGAGGIVRKIAVLPDQKLIVGGEFTHFVTSSRRNIARLNADGSLDQTFRPGLGFESGSRVNDIAVLDSGRIAVAGNFVTFNGVIQRLITVINPDGTRDVSFSAGFTQSGDITKVIALPGSKLLIIGSFRFGSETLAPRIAVLNSDGTRDTSFAPVFAPLNITTAFLDATGKIFVSGSFTTVNGVARTFLVKLNSDGSVDPSFNLILSNFTLVSITDIGVQPNGQVFIAGLFQSNDGQTVFSQPSLRLNPDGALDASLVFSYNRSLGSPFVIQPDNRVVGIGGFGFGAAAAPSVARFRSTGLWDSSFNPNGSNFGLTYTMAIQADNKILVGGNFNTSNGFRRAGIVRLVNDLRQPLAVFDFEGDGRTDISVFRPSVGEWWLNSSSTSSTVAAQFGSSVVKPVAADFTGDATTDIAFWLPSTGEWFVLRSEDGTFFSFPFGTTGDVPFVADFDSDGRADPSIFRPSSATWFISKSSGGTSIFDFGASGDMPVPADFDGDGIPEVAIFRPSLGEWWMRRSVSGLTQAFRFGIAGDIPVAGDYTGDGRADPAVFRPSTGTWFILRSEDRSFFSFPFGASGDVPTPGDYDGDGRSDVAVYRPSEFTWFVNRTTAGILIGNFGTTNDRPIPGIFLP